MSIVNSVELVNDEIRKLGFKQSKIHFNFEQMPSNLIDRAFRVQVERTGTINENMGGELEKTANIAIWIAFSAEKIKTSRTEKHNLALLESEKIEDALYTLPFLVSESGVTLEHEDLNGSLMVYKISFAINYRRVINVEQ